MTNKQIKKKIKKYKKKIKNLEDILALEIKDIDKDFGKMPITFIPHVGMVFYFED